MSRAIHRRDDCRLCNGRDLTLVLSLAPTPPANAFVSQQDRDKPQERFPLDVFMCAGCGHVQLLDVVDPRVLFEHYVYVSGTSPVFVRHFEAYADAVAGYLGAPLDLVVDIGSNDGTLLRAFKARGARVLGIDPAREIANTASRQGIETLPEFFDVELARRIRSAHGPANVVTANNVFAHIDDLAGTADGISVLLADDGLFVFEVSYLVDVLEKTLFDTIYHEHLAYHTVRSLCPFLAAHGLELIEAVRVDSHGGSLRGIAQKLGGARAVGESVARAVAHEERLGLAVPQTLQRFAAHIDARKRELGELLQGARDRGERVAGFGAPAKATTLMYHFGIGPETMDFVVDDSPLKQGLYTPGMHVPVLPSAAIYDRRPEWVVVLAWNFAESIMSRHAAYREGGGRFVVPLPNVEVF